MSDSFIGVMDSGMGGLSVLKTLTREMPCERFVYWGDNAHAPYGTREAGVIYELTKTIVEHLVSGGAKAIVIACNTATSAAARQLRETLDMPVFGLEPALKPASACAEGGKVLALATEATIKLDKYQQLLGQYGKNVESIPCPELVEFVEHGIIEGADLENYFNKLFGGYAGEKISGIVLGCTHFVWLKKTIRKCAGDVPVFDGNEGLARHVRKVLSDTGRLRGTGAGSVELHTTSDDPEIMKTMRQLYSLELT